MSAGFTSYTTVRVALFCLLWAPTSPRKQRTNPPRLETQFMEFSKFDSPFQVNLYWDLWEDRGRRKKCNAMKKCNEEISCPATSPVELLMFFLTKAVPWMTRASAIRHVTSLKNIFPLFLRQLGLSYSWISKALHLYYFLISLVFWVFFSVTLKFIQHKNF